MRSSHLDFFLPVGSFYFGLVSANPVLSVDFRASGAT